MSIISPEVQYALDNAPQPGQDADTFTENGYRMSAALSPFASQLSDFAESLDTFSLQSTSTGSLAIGLGAKTLPADPGKSFQVGMTARLAYTADGTKWMQGDITAYNFATGSLSLNVDRIKGTGTFASWNIFTSDLMEQPVETVVTAGAQPAYTATTVLGGPYVTNERLTIVVHATATAAPSLNRDAQGAKSIKQLDITGAKVPGVLLINTMLMLQYDGIDYVILNPLSLATNRNVPVRQTVLNGPLDASGLPNFGGVTGATTVTAAGTLTATAANGFDLNGAVNRVGQITNPQWTGMNGVSTRYYGYFDIAADGTITTGVTTLAPTYRPGGADVITNNQFTFNKQEMIGKVGNGAAAVQAYRVFVGEFLTNGASVVSSITWYALMGKYDSGYTNTLPGTATNISRNHNIGDVPAITTLEIKCLTPDIGFSVGDVATPYTQSAASYVAPFSPSKTNMIMQATVGSAAAWNVNHKSTGAVVTVTTLANWAYRLTADRGW